MDGRFNSTARDGFVGFAEFNVAAGRKMTLLRFCLF